MAVTIENTAATQAELAIAAYIRNRRDSNADTSTYTGTIDYDCNRSGNALDNIPIYEGRMTQKHTTPYVLVKCETATKLWDMENYYEASVDVILYTHWRESENSVELAEVEHRSRAKAIFDLITNEETIFESVNKPSLPTADNRPVKNFHTDGVLPGDNQIDVQVGEIVEQWNLQVFCYPFDALTA